MKKILITLFVISMLAVSLGFVIADKPDKFDSQGNEIGWASAHEGCTRIQDGTLVGADGCDLVLGYNQWGYNYQAHMFNGMWCDYHPTYRPDGANYQWCLDNMADVELMMKWSDAWLSNTDCEGEDNLLDRHFGFPSYIGSGAWLTNHERGSYLGNWGVSGDWVVLANNVNSHDMFITEQTDGTFKGYGGYPSGSQHTHKWDIENGLVDGNTIHMDWIYTTSSYKAYFDGVILPDGSMEGTFYDTSGHIDLPWKSTSGVATRETCEYEYFVKIVAAPADANLLDGVWFAADGVEIGPEIWGAFAIIQGVSNDPCGGLDSDEYTEYHSPSPTGFGFYNAE